MKFYLGDECGLIKEVNVLLAQEEKLAKPLVKKSIFAHNQKTTTKADEGDNKKNKQKEENELQAVTIRDLGKIDKTKAVEKLCWCLTPFIHPSSSPAVSTNSKLAWVARSQGVLELLDVVSGNVLYSYKAEEVEGTVPAEKIRKWVGLSSSSSSLIACDSFGKVYQFQFDVEKGYEPIVVRTQGLYSPIQFISCFSINPKSPNIIATGGENVELALWDLDTLFDFTPDAVKPKFMARNVPHDKLDLKVPVWVTSIGFLTPTVKNSYRVIITTHYGQIRVYETSIKRRPVLEHQIGTSPLLSHEVNSDEKQVIYSDNLGNLQVVDLTTGTVLGKYKGITGTVRQTLLVTPSNDGLPPTDATPPLLISVALDRFLRIHHFQLDSRALVRRIYVKQRPTVFLLDHETQHDTLPKRPREATDALWDTLDQVTTTKKSKSTATSS